MPSPEEIRQAKELVGDVERFLSEKGGETAVVCLTREFHAGALFALDWVLDGGKGDLFQRHLEALAKFRRQLVGAQP